MNHTNLEINCLIWIRSLPERELGPSNRMNEAVADVCIANNISMLTYEINNINEYKSLFNEIIKLAANENLKPIIHFDMHGDAKNGLLLSPSADRVDYNTLCEDLSNINEKTSNNLVCFFAVCEAFQYLFNIKSNKHAPSYITISTPEKITVGVLEETVAPFYQDLFYTNNLNQAYNNNCKNNYILHHSIKAFIQYMRSFLSNYNTGKGERTIY